MRLINTKIMNPMILVN